MPEKRKKGLGLGQGCLVGTHAVHERAVSLYDVGVAWVQRVGELQQSEGQSAHNGAHATLRDRCWAQHTASRERKQEGFVASAGCLGAQGGGTGMLQLIEGWGSSGGRRESLCKEIKKQGFSSRKGEGKRQGASYFWCIWRHLHRQVSLLPRARLCRTVPNALL